MSNKLTTEMLSDILPFKANNPNNYFHEHYTLGTNKTLTCPVSESE